MHHSTHLVVSSLLSLLSFAWAQGDKSDFPTLTTDGSDAAATSGGYDGISNAPKVTNSNAVPTYPAPSIPPTSEAPFMQKSTYPQGTVFIIAGAAIGFLIVCVLLWYAWVAWSVRRGMQRAKKGYTSLATQGPQEPGFFDRGVQLLKKTTPFYSQPESGSMIAMSLLHNDEQRAAAAAASHPSSTYPPDKKSLFFSPTASSAYPATRIGARRESGYMPSGYYAAGGPDRAKAHSLAQSQTPDEQHESTAYAQHGASGATSGLAAQLLAAQQSTTSLNTGQGSRAPSTYMEDMFNAAPVSQDGFNRL